MNAQPAGQPKITGYRNLPEQDVALINQIKHMEGEVLLLAAQVRARIASQQGEAATVVEAERLRRAEPERWAALARTDFQTGFMKLVRAVAQPDQTEHPGVKL
jgi:hypothetical protein